MRDYTRGIILDFGRQISENVGSQIIFPVLRSALPQSDSPLLKGTILEKAGDGALKTTAAPALVAAGMSLSDAARDLAAAAARFSPGGSGSSISGAGFSSSGGSGLPTYDPSTGTFSSGAIAPAASMASAAVTSTTVATGATALLKAMNTPSIFGGGNFGAGLSSVGSNNALAILMGTNTTGPTTLSSQIGAGVGLGGMLAAGGLAIYSGIEQGGIGGDMKAAGSAAGIAGAAVGEIAKAIGAVSPVLSAIPIVGTALAAVLPLVGSLLGNNVEKRQNNISQELQANAYLAPTALNVTQSSSGTFTTLGTRGNLETTDFSPYPKVTEPFLWEQTHGLLGPPPTWYQVPGGQTSQFGAPVNNQSPETTTPAVRTGSEAQPVVHNHYWTVNAMDSQSFTDFARTNHMAIGEAAADNLQQNPGRFAAEVKNTATYG